MIEINLIPDVKQELIRARTQRSAVVSISIFITLAFIALAIVLSVYVFGVQTVRSAIADSQIKKGAEQLAQVEDLSKVLTIQNQLTKVNDLNDSKKIDSRVFQILQAIIPPAPNSVTVSNLTIDTETGSLTFEGQTSSYPSLETFKKTIAAANIRYTDNGEQKDVPLASDLSISDISYGEDSTGSKVVRFSVSFTYADETFSPLVSNPSIVLINGGNVTDSYQGIPKSIFADRAADTEASQ